MSRAVDVGLRIEWLARVVPTQAWESYEAVRAPALAAYRVARDQAMAAYQADRDQALAAYHAADAQALAAYRRAIIGPLVRALRAEGAAQFPRADS
jgi:hypothetical protein